jgi:hypothetical protein
MEAMLALQSDGNFDVFDEFNSLHLLPWQRLGFSTNTPLVT